MCTGNFFGNKTLATPPLLCDQASHAYPQFPKSTKKLTCSAGYYSLVVLVNSIGMISSLLFW